jgi:hypothetical protein
MFHSAETLRALVTAEQCEEAVFLSRLMFADLEERGPLEDALDVIRSKTNTALKTAETLAYMR